MRQFRTVLLIFFLLMLSGSHPASAETLTLKTYYPSPFGAYTRLRLVPIEELSGECESGTLYSSIADQSLRYCVGQDNGNSGQWQPLVPFRMERGTLTVHSEDVYPVRFTEPFFDIPIVQAYLVVEDKAAPGGEIIMNGNFFSLVGISPEGFSVNHHGSEERMNVLWVAIGD